MLSAAPISTAVWVPIAWHSCSASGPQQLRGCWVQAAGERSINLKCPELDTSADVCNFKHILKLDKALSMKQTVLVLSVIFEKLWASFGMGSWISKGNWRFGQVWLKFPKFFENSLQKSLLSLLNCQAQSGGLPEIINISLPLPFPVRPDTNFGYKVWKEWLKWKMAIWLQRTLFNSSICVRS